MIFSREDTEIPTPRFKIVTRISKWENYESIEINGIKYIRGYSDDNTSELFQFDVIDTPIILYHFLELYTKLPHGLFSSDQYYINSLLTDSDISLILAFCKKHGLPFWSNKPTANPFEIITEENDVAISTMLHEVIPFSKENYFPVCSFIAGLNSLHTDFLKVVSANLWEDDENIHLLLSDNDRKRISEFRKIQSKHKSIGLYTPNLFPYLTFWNDNIMSLQLNCNNLMHLSTFYLCTLQQAQDCTGGSIRICPKCKQPFVYKTPQQKFCLNPCTRQSYYSQNNRKKKE